MVTKALAAVLNSAFARALEARKAVEHRLASIPRQESIVRQWQENLPDMAATNYPNHDVLSYPVQTRLQREFEKLERYNTELPERIARYSHSLKIIEQTIGEILVLTSGDSSLELEMPLPPYPAVLNDDPWPKHWPPRTSYGEKGKWDDSSYTFNINRVLPSKKLPSLTAFKLEIAGHIIELEALYSDGIEPFTTSLEDFLHGASSSRWPAIIEAIRCGIQWPQLDSYLVECKHPWLPEDFVNAEFGLRGTLERRDELADIMAEISPDAGRWYLAMQPMSYRLRSFRDLDHDIIEELMIVGLVRWGPDMHLGELLRELPFSEVKSLFALSALPIPRSFDGAVGRFEELVLARGEDYIRDWIANRLDISEMIEVLEVSGWYREERLGPRARANVLVSTLVLLNENNPGPIAVVQWGR